MRARLAAMCVVYITKYKAKTLRVEEFLENVFRDFLTIGFWLRFRGLGRWGWSRRLNRGWFWRNWNRHRSLRLYYRSKRGLEVIPAIGSDASGLGHAAEGIKTLETSLTIGRRRWARTFRSAFHRSLWRSRRWPVSRTTIVASIVSSVIAAIFPPRLLLSLWRAAIFRSRRGRG